eukprot:5027485-Prorocentrum_lima.AAC.1
MAGSSSAAPTTSVPPGVSSARSFPASFASLATGSFAGVSGVAPATPVPRPIPVIEMYSRS